MGNLVKISVCNRRTDKKYKNQEQTWDYILDVFLEECRENNVSILDAINYYIKNKK